MKKSKVEKIVKILGIQLPSDAKEALKVAVKVEEIYHLLLRTSQLEKEFQKVEKILIETLEGTGLSCPKKEINLELERSTNDLDGFIEFLKESENEIAETIEIYEKLIRMFAED